MRWSATGRGWGLHADEAITAGDLVGSYAGSFVTSADARARLAEYDAAEGGHALLVARCWLPSGRGALRINIDATRTGNALRFANHACGRAANMATQVVLRRGCALPFVVLVAARDVGAGEELTFDYGGAEGREGGGGQEAGGRVRCLCGGADCGGWLPAGAV